MIILLLFYISFLKIYSKKFTDEIVKTKLNYNKKQNIIHFIKCGHGDSILIEGNGHFGLIDSANHFINIRNNNQINYNYQGILIILNYLKYLKVKKLDFIIGTHAHSDHIGGIEALSSEYVDDKTIYYYKEYNCTHNLDKYVNYTNYLNVLNSIKKKNAKLVDVTNKTIEFHFGEMNIRLFNTYIYKNKIIFDENQNSILILILFKNIKIFLPGDMTKINSYDIDRHFRNINILKLPHHGFGDISINNIRKLKPNVVVISSDFLYIKAIKLIKYMKNKYKSKIYILKFIKKYAIKLYLYSNINQKYYFSENVTTNFILKNSKIYRKLFLNIFLLIIIIISKIYYLKIKKIKTFANDLQYQ